MPNARRTMRSRARTSVGTASDGRSVMPVPAGFHRVYARIDGLLSAEKMWRSIKAGRSFATPGPMLTLEANGHDIGVIAEDGEPLAGQ